MGQWDPADSFSPGPAGCLIAICLLPSWENMLDWSYFMLGLTLSLSVFYIMSLWLSLFCPILVWPVLVFPPFQKYLMQREQDRDREEQKHERFQRFQCWDKSDWVQTDINQQSSGVWNRFLKEVVSGSFSNVLYSNFCYTVHCCFSIRTKFSMLISESIYTVRMSVYHFWCS